MEVETNGDGNRSMTVRWDSSIPFPWDQFVDGAVGVEDDSGVTSDYVPLARPAFVDRLEAAIEQRSKASNP
jgi:hypothetical protein